MGLSWFWKRRDRQPGEKAFQILLYTRKGCHLCETAWRRLQSRQRKHGFTLKAVDVDNDLYLAARYANEVPVVTVNGKVRFRGEVNEVLLDRLLGAEAGRSSEQG
jgi:glutaredoxin